MLNMMIVDDEKLLTDSLKSDVDWQSLGIEAVFTAYNARQAKEVFEQERVDLILCDIEMPQESGLELLAWVRNNYPQTETVFMTCHAEFKLAQRALQLGSFDYLLKPIPGDELQQVIGKVVEKIMRDQEVQQYSRIGQFWARHQPLLAERLWLDVINHTIPSHPEHIQRAAEERNIPFDRRMRLLPILISVQRYHKTFSPRDEKIIEYALLNSGEEILHVHGNGLLFGLTEGTLLALIPFEREAESYKETLRNRSEEFIASCTAWFYCDVSIYIGNAVYGHEVSEMVGQLVRWDKGNVTFTNKVFVWGSKQRIHDTIKIPDMNAWSIMLKEGQGVQVVIEAEVVLKSWIGTEGPGAETLHRFHHNFLQMVFYVLKLKGIEAHLLFENEASERLYQRAVRSVSDMIPWVRHTVNTAMESMGTLQRTDSIIDKVEQFIQERIESEELSRETVANHVYLNPDYLDRLFKKEAGASVTEYIMRRRLDLAKDLLLKTNLPIGAIASQTGYSNFAHFSRRFKKQFGMSPADYRKQAANGSIKEKSI